MDNREGWLLSRMALGDMEQNRGGRKVLGIVQDILRGANSHVYYSPLKAHKFSVCSSWGCADRKERELTVTTNAHILLS